MPAAPRWNKKGKEIAEDLLGKPDNAVDVEDKKQKKVKRWLVYEEGQWAR